MSLNTSKYISADNDNHFKNNEDIVDNSFIESTCFFE